MRDGMTENEAMNEKKEEPCGVLVIDKPAGMTSFDVVKRVRHIYGVQRVGHTGTLDPDATGVLIVLVGRAVKAASYASASKKRYTTCLKLGVATDTEDMSGRVISRSESIPHADEVEAAVSSYLGEYMQTPPMYSALKVGGQKLVNLARRGVTVERSPRLVIIHSIEIVKSEAEDEYVLDVSCSSGTYIRTLCADIGNKLGCGGCMKWLRRTEVGRFTLNDAVDVHDIASDPEECLCPVDELFDGIPRIDFSLADAMVLFNGGVVEVAPDDIKIPEDAGVVGRQDGIYAFCRNGRLFALGRIGSAGAKTAKLFTIHADEI
ncbi:MAG: tRNA pseudouridine(55) synthase TruB [Firmicutes bacterium]|nr:tRNA pseudouridine(55) synthase TruB [Bacillota bacterium]